MKHLSKEVSFKINQLLYDKGWRYELGVDETGHKVKNSLAEQRWNEGDLTYVDITIAQVIDWLYEKHGVWIWVSMELGYTATFCWQLTGEHMSSDYKPNFKSPTEAYESAIEYALTNLV